jgi:hypothetical protein
MAGRALRRAILDGEHGVLGWNKSNPALVILFFGRLLLGASKAEPRMEKDLRGRSQATEASAASMALHEGSQPVDHLRRNEEPTAERQNSTFREVPFPPSTRRRRRPR